MLSRSVTVGLCAKIQLSSSIPAKGTYVYIVVWFYNLRPVFCLLIEKVEIFFKIFPPRGIDADSEDTRTKLAWFRDLAPYLPRSGTSYIALSGQYSSYALDQRRLKFSIIAHNARPFTHIVRLLIYTQMRRCCCSG